MEHHTKIIDCTIRDGGLVNNWILVSNLYKTYIMA